MYLQDFLRLEAGCLGHGIMDPALSRKMKGGVERGVGRRICPGQGILPNSFPSRER